MLEKISNWALSSCKNKQLKNLIYSKSNAKAKQNPAKFSFQDYKNAFILFFLQSSLKIDVFLTIENAIYIYEPNS